MRILILKDLLIKQSEIDTFTKEFIPFIERYTLIIPEFKVEDMNYKDYPVEVDTDGTFRPKHDWLTIIGEDVKARNGSFAFDHVIVLIHEKNWKNSDGRKIWGTNYSAVYGDFHLHYCRFDERNKANTFGTIYHEMHHSLDALIKIETGVDVNSILGVKKWDSGITHGGEKPWGYIRHKENTESLVEIASHLRKAYAMRLIRHEEFRKKLKGDVIRLARQVIYLLRKKLNAKNGLKL